MVAERVSRAGAALPSSRWAVVVSWMLVVVWAGLIFAASAKSAAELDLGTGPLALAKAWLAQVLLDLTGHAVDPSPIGHFSEYLVFGVLLLNAFSRLVDIRPTVLLTILVAALYAASDEFHQLFVPGRACDPLDWLVDMAAVLLATLVCSLLFRRSRA